MTCTERHRRADRLWLLAGGLLLLLWEAAGADLPLARLYGSAQGFAWRDAWLTRSVLHDGGRSLSALVLAWMVLGVVWPRNPGPTRRERACWLAVTISALLLVPALKQFSATSCPWDLAAFGGAAAYVPHWLPAMRDGGPGRCFPSGHAVAAFAFFSLYFLWRPHHPGRARAALLAVLVLGGLFGWAQMARGAHFASHTLWSAWICWALCSTAAALLVPPTAAAATARP